MYNIPWAKNKYKERMDILYFRIILASSEKIAPAFLSDYNFGCVCVNF